MVGTMTPSSATGITGYVRDADNAVQLAASSAKQLADAGALRAIGLTPSTVLAAIDQYREHGASALPPSTAVYDADTATLTLAGPLYYAEHEDGFVFADSPRGILASDVVDPVANDEAVIRFLLTGACDEGDITFFAGIRRVPAQYSLVRTAATTTVTPARDQRFDAREVEPDAVRFGGGVTGAALVHEFAPKRVYYASFGPLDDSEDRYVTAALNELDAACAAHAVRVDADTLGVDLADFIASIGEPVPDAAAYVQFAVARAAGADNVHLLADPAEAGPPAAARKPANARALLASSAVVGQSITQQPVADWAAPVRRVAARLEAQYGISFLLPYVDDPRAEMPIPPAARRAVGGRRPTAPLREWLLRLKNRIYEIFHTESFVARPWFDAAAVRLAFEGFIKGRNTDSELFWRIVQIELWAREFLDPAANAVSKPTKGVLEANDGKNLAIDVAGEQWDRLPIRTEIFNSGDSLDERISGYVTEVLREARDAYGAGLTTGWYLLVSEKIVAISQGRSYFVWDIQPSWWARTLSKYVVKTPYGIGLGSPWTMQLAIQEAGLPRILFASAVSAAGKLVGKRGLFYEVAGHSVAAIDGPTEYSVYPANVSAKLPPAEPDKVATRLRAAVAKALRAQGLAEIADALRGVVVIDANDLGRDILGNAADRDDEFFELVFADNPLGQGSQQTPLALVFPHR